MSAIAAVQVPAPLPLGFSEPNATVLSCECLYRSLCLFKLEFADPAIPRFPISALEPMLSRNIRGGNHHLLFLVRFELDGLYFERSRVNPEAYESGIHSDDDPKSFIGPGQLKERKTACP